MAHEFADEVSIADDMLRSGYERWHRLEEEKAAIGEDLKELFAELKANGFAPKALRESFRRVRNIDDASQQEHDAIVDLYVASLTGARPAHTREDDESTTPNASVPEGFDPETGEEVTTPNSALAASNSDADAPVPSGAAKEVSPDASFAPIQPETAQEVPHALEPTRGEHAAIASSEHARSHGQAAGRPPESQTDGTDNRDGVERHAPMQDGLGPVEAHNLEQAGSTPAPATNSLTGSAADKSGEAGGVSPSASTAPTKLKMNAEFFDEPHPACQRPGFCGGNSAIALCDECKSAAGQAVHVETEEHRVLN